MDSGHTHDASSNPGAMRRLRLRYPGTCAACGTPLAKGAEAFHDPLTKTLRCLECPTQDQNSDEQPIDPGHAGGSAWREYERLKAKRETRVKDRVGKRLGGLFLALSDEPQSTRAWAKGARGEAALAEALAGLPDVNVLNDRRVPGTVGNIDHIVVAPAGVFVVDAKSYEGLIRIRDRGGLFRSDDRLYVGRRRRTAPGRWLGRLGRLGRRGPAVRVHRRQRGAGRGV